MPEGHTLHRLASTIRDQFSGQPVGVSSPQGRFAASARLLDGTELVGAEAWGKHLFIDFAGERHVHVHLGLYGRLDVHAGPPPDPVGQVRLRLVSTGSPSPSATAGGAPRPVFADLRGATACDLLSARERDAVVARVGPDPLRPEADPARAWARISRSKVPVGGLLMDQEVMSGVGNVYRAELLFRHRIHPLRPGNTLRRSQFAEMWEDVVQLMQYGVRTGRIDTVRPEHTPEAMNRAPRRDDHGGEVYVYRRHGQPCLVCGSKVRTDVLAGRNVFWCPRCQPRFRSRAASR